MPIDSNDAKTTIDFRYTNGDSVTPMRFHHDEVVGPAITMSLVMNGERYESVFPADMFIEVSDFLRSQNLMPTASAPEPSLPTTTISLPTVSDTSSLAPGMVPFDSEEDEQDTEEQEVESFDPSSVSPVENLGSIESVHSGVHSMPSSPSSDEILAERQQAVSKADSGPRIIKKL